MENILEMRKISKAFYGVQALNNVDFSVLRVKPIFSWAKMALESPH